MNEYIYPKIPQGRPRQDALAIEAAELKKTKSYKVIARHQNISPDTARKRVKQGQRLLAADQKALGEISPPEKTQS
jgi:hypothetical protein